MPRGFLITLVTLMLVTAVFGVTQYFVEKNIPEPTSEAFGVPFAEYLQNLEGTEIPFEAANHYVSKDGFTTTLETLMAVRPHCHTEAHAIGRAFYAKTLDLGEAVMQCGRSCTDGCFHGVIMGLFSKGDVHSHAPDEPEHDPHPMLTEENRTEVERTLLTLCDDTAIQKVTNGRPGDCYHATGHAALFVTNYDTLAALDLCMQFTNLGAQHYCATGVYMERNITKGLDDNNVSLFYPCSEAGRFSAACYRYELQEIHDKQLAPQEAVLAHCRSVTNLVEQRGCFHGYGFAYHYSVQTNLPEIANLCQYGDTIAQELCIEGAIGAAGNQIPETITEACAYLPDYLQTACMTGVRERSFGMNRDFSRYTNLTSDS